ncbi:MAG TPA: TIGR03000 domain-containing protein [Gemmataceae bacterium]|nr:TIGR03000 domain-containing protein [Gemmataceae bacterium]
MCKALLSFALAVAAVLTASAPRAQAAPVPNQAIESICAAQHNWPRDFGWIWGGGWRWAWYSDWSWGWGTGWQTCPSCYNDPNYCPLVHPYGQAYWWDYPYNTTSYYHPLYYYYWATNLKSGPYAGGGAQGMTNPAATAAPPVTYATVEVWLPANAELWINGNKMTETGPRRSFNTDALTKGQTLSVEVQVKWMDKGSQQTQTRSVQLQAGNQRVMNFQPDAVAVKKY